MYAQSGYNESIQRSAEFPWNTQTTQTSSAFTLIVIQKWRSLESNSHVELTILYGTIYKLLPQSLVNKRCQLGDKIQNMHSMSLSWYLFHQRPLLNTQQGLCAEVYAEVPITIKICIMYTFIHKSSMISKGGPLQQRPLMFQVDLKFCQFLLSAALLILIECHGQRRQKHGKYRT